MAENLPFWPRMLVPSERGRFHQTGGIVLNQKPAALPAAQPGAGEFDFGVGRFGDADNGRQLLQGRGVLAPLGDGGERQRLES